MLKIKMVAAGLSAMVSSTAEVQKSHMKMASTLRLMRMENSSKHRTAGASRELPGSQAWGLGG